MSFIQPLVGIALILLIAYVVSEKRSLILSGGVLKGMVFQFGLALVLLKTPEVQNMFFKLNDVVLAIQKATIAGTSLVFGYVGGGSLPFNEIKAGGSFILGFQALPMIMIFSALSAILYYWCICLGPRSYFPAQRCSQFCNHRDSFCWYG